MAHVMPSSIVASVSIATMSVRGVIASRTTMSPNSKIEWMSLRSSRSIASASAATSAIVRISSSDTNGPSFSPRPGSSRFARPMRLRESTRRGGKYVTAYRKRETPSAARSVFWIANVLGMTSAITKNTTIWMTMPAITPYGPNNRSSRTPIRLALVSWETSTRRSTTLRVSSGCSSIRARRPAPFCPSSSNARARMRLMRVKAVSERASRIENRNRAMMTASSAQSVPLTAVDRRSPVFFPLDVVEPLEQLALALPHRLGLLVLGMVVVQQMQYAVHDEQRELVIERPAAAVGLAFRHLRAHDHVTEHARRLSGLGWRAWPAPALIRLTATGRDVLVHGEREHIRGPAAAEEPLVEIGDRLLVDEDDRQLRVLRHALLVEHHPREPHP